MSTPEEIDPALAAARSAVVDTFGDCAVLALKRGATKSQLVASVVAAEAALDAYRDAAMRYRATLSTTEDN